MVHTVVRRWGNSNGVVLPKHLAEQAGVHAGDTLEAQWDPASRRIMLTPTGYRPRRTRHLTIDSLFADWHPTDTQAHHGDEADWGDDVGAEQLP